MSINPVILAGANKVRIVVSSPSHFSFRVKLSIDGSTWVDYNDGAVYSAISGVKSILVDNCCGFNYFAVEVFDFTINPKIEHQLVYCHKGCDNDCCYDDDDADGGIVIKHPIPDFFDKYPNIFSLRSVEPEHGKVVQIHNLYSANDKGGGEFQCYMIQKSEQIVEDNALTIRSQHPGYVWRRVLINNWVAPEYFGAVGDGVTNDLNAFLAAVNSGKDVFALSEQYLLDVPDYPKWLNDNDEITEGIMFLNDFQQIDLNNANIIHNLYNKPLFVINEKNSCAIKNATFTFKGFRGVFKHIVGKLSNTGWNAGHTVNSDRAHLISQNGTYLNPWPCVISISGSRHTTLSKLMFTVGSEQINDGQQHGYCGVIITNTDDTKTYGLQFNECSTDGYWALCRGHSVVGCHIKDCRGYRYPAVRPGDSYTYGDNKVTQTDNSIEPAGHLFYFSGDCTFTPRDDIGWDMANENKEELFREYGQNDNFWGVSIYDFGDCVGKQTFEDSRANADHDTFKVNSPGSVKDSAIRVVSYRPHGCWFLYNSSNCIFDLYSDMSSATPDNHSFQSSWGAQPNVFKESYTDNFANINVVFPKEMTGMRAWIRSASASNYALSKNNVTRANLFGYDTISGGIRECLNGLELTAKVGLTQDNETLTYLGDFYDGEKAILDFEVDEQVGPTRINIKNPNNLVILRNFESDPQWYGSKDQVIFRK